MAGFAATDEAERTEDDEAADGFTDGAGADADAAGEPGHGEVELEPAFETGVAEEMKVDGAVGDRQAQARVENVRELYPEVLEIESFASWRILRRKWRVVSDQWSDRREDGDSTQRTPRPGRGKRRPEHRGRSTVKSQMRDYKKSGSGAAALRKRKRPRRKSRRSFLRWLLYYKNNLLSRGISMIMISN